MTPRKSLKKNYKYSSIKENYIPFLDLPLTVIMSILNFMKSNRKENTDKEIDMYYSTKNKYPFDSLSKKQMEVFGCTFSNESNIESLIKINPIPILPTKLLPKCKDLSIIEQPTLELKTYPSPIGPLSFLNNTVPQQPDRTFVNFLEACSK